MFEDLLLLTMAFRNKGGGGGGDIPLISRSDWDLLPPQDKRAKGLTAIQDYMSGYHRGELVDGHAYVPEPIAVGAYSINGGSTGLLEHTFETSGKHFIYICYLLGEVGSKPLSNISVEINGQPVSGIDYEMPDTNNDLRANLYTFEYTANSGDILTVRNTTAYAQSGFQLFVFQNVSGIEWYNCRSNNGTTFPIELNPSYHLQVYLMGYYNGRNNFSYEVSDKDGNSIGTPDTTMYWYGGTYVVKLLQEGIVPVPEPRILFGKTEPDSALGNDGDYYYRRVKKSVDGF